ncbi:amino acid adenylation domain-containing protein [Nannocystis exedens]|uniref:Amino acid adenylation domain-containing protein n=1 Tax=Nannocystis exedens TaxID=54 RepID=A0A1I2I3C3_9BACT|nr:non-ribosomal peptide synthetase [Nannocystis exedens]PCC68477.1 non-ribosomal peptide synthetase [Nannocystis exedens]SFF36110.1 amino acid adenylation domain-containing protein [Nannocystis exedens]
MTDEDDSLSRRRKALSADQQALLARRVRAASQHLQRPAIPRRAGDEPQPLSFAQQRLWFLHRLDPASSFYNISESIRLRSLLDVEALTAALRQLVARHEALRTSFAEHDGEPRQTVHAPGPLALHVDDLRGVPGEQREAEMRRRARDEARRPFDLARPPLLRALLLRLDEREHVLVLTTHHLVCDGWSLGILVRELTALYAAARRGVAGELPQLAVQYADFAAWEQGADRAGQLDAELKYWREQLADLPVLQLPTDRPRPAVRSFAGDVRTRALSPALLRGLQRLAAGSEATLFMVLLAAWGALLHRYTGQRDFAVGSPIAGRNLVELEPVVGFFVNTLALRIDLAGDPSFAELLRRVRATATAAYAHQELPFERLVQALHPERSASHQPVCQVVFALQNAPLPPLQLADLETELLAVHDGTAKFELLLSMREVDGGLAAAVEFSTDLFDGPRIERMLGHLEQLLTAAVAEPARRVSQMPLLTAEERHRLLVAWNAQGGDGAPELLQRGFEAQARRTPDATAAVFGAARLTYAELDRRANRLAHQLRALGVGPDVRVGICMRRSLELPVAVLAALKAGGAFVPLDPSYPPERLAVILEEARPRVLLTQTELAERWRGGPAEVVALDPGWRPDDAWPDVAPDTGVVPGNLAYVIYTSGSTGRPKGIAMSHVPIANLIQWHTATTTLPHGGATLQFASLNFDVSFQELFATWALGGSVHLITEEQRRDPDALLRLIADQRIERLFLPMVMLQSLAEAACARGPLPASVREVFAGGEPLQISRQVQQMYAAIGGALHNHYGPSECHVVTDCTLQGDPSTWPALPPIGRPLPNLRLYLLDGRMQPVPIGVAGELFIGGIVLARGYLDRPDITAERFVPDPFGPRPGGRLYRTGDFARYLPDGALEFLGRIDHQVKIRGFRIELVEIEAALGEHPAVADCAVLVREDRPGDKRLVAYVASAAEPAAAELRAFLRAKLPEYMVPAAFVCMRALPVDPNGKTDRRALAGLALGQVEVDRSDVPQTEAERRVAAIWCELLGLDQVGAHDNFFDLGGHSLLVPKLQRALQDAFGREVAAAELFQYTTVAALADHLRDAPVAAEAGHERAEAREAASRRNQALRERRRGARG